MVLVVLKLYTNAKLKYKNYLLFAFAFLLQLIKPIKQEIKQLQLIITISKSKVVIHIIIDTMYTTIHINHCSLYLLAISHVAIKETMVEMASTT